MTLHDPFARPGSRIPTTRPWTVRRKPAPSSLPPLTQRYAAMWLDAEGGIDDLVAMGPQVPLFTQAFTAIVRGTLVATTGGPVAVEDLSPGMKVITGQGPDTLMWIGSQTVMPNAKGKVLYRIPADTLGPARPGFDLMLGPAARVVSRRSGLQGLVGDQGALVPIAALADGMNVIEITPASAVQTFHLGFRWHRTFAVNGIEIESVHPGSLDPALGDALVALYMTMFPHLARPEDFGALQLPRLTGDQLERFAA